MRESRDEDATHHSGSGGELVHEVEVAVLQRAACNDVLERRVSDVANRKDNGCAGGGHRAQVVREAKYGPVVTDGAEVGVERVCELAVCNELRTHVDVRAGLVG